MKKRVSPLKRMGQVLGSLILLLAAAFGILMYAVPALEGVDRTEVTGSSDWMAALPENVPLGEIVLPGAHDCATAGVQLAFFSRCQALSVAEQLRAGVRYLDVRLSMEEGRLRLVHGFTGCIRSLAPWSGGLYLEDVLAACRAFLDEHPTETVIFAVKKDHGGESEAEFSRALEAAIGDDDGWLITDRLPTLAEARGKLVLMRRYTRAEDLGAGAGLPLYWEEQGNREDTRLHGAAADNGGYTVWVQDRYKYDAGDKYAAFLAALAEPTDAELAVSFLSTNGNAAYGHPAKHARALNARLLADDTPLRGWVVVDFASPRLAERIYRENFR